MSADKELFNNINGDFSEIPGISEAPADIAPETVEFLKGLIESFNESAASLKDAYNTLQNKFDALNLRLEETNEELKQSLDEQERLSNYLTNILESLSSGVLVVDVNGVITLFNRGAELITGIKVDDAINKSYREVMGTDTPEELTPLWVLSNKESRSQMEKTIVSQSGITLPVGFSISPLLNTSGELLGAVEIFMDMSRIKALEDELSRLDKLAALGQMSATMAHKIRNPLGGIAGYAGLLDIKIEKDDDKRYIRRIIEGVNKINHIITSVLSYNSQLQLTPCEIDLIKSIDNVVDRAKLDMDEEDRSRITFTVNRPSKHVIIEADSDQLNLALLHIVRNAIESIEGKGNVNISFNSQQPRRSSSPSLITKLLKKMSNDSRILKSKRPCSVIIVTDSGIGMDEFTLNNLFVPFYTTKEKGIGLGLASAQKIIEAHHGETWIESALNSGTAVGIILPSKSIVVSNHSV